MRVQLPPALFDPKVDAPPGDAWDLQLMAPRAYIAWLAQQSRSTTRAPVDAAVEPYEAAVAQAVGTIAALLPDVPLTEHYHHSVPWSRRPQPHMHVFLGARDTHGDPVTREQITNAGATAYIAQLDRLVDVTEATPELGVTWTSSGIVGVQDTWVIDYTACPGPWGPRTPVLACP